MAQLIDKDLIRQKIEFFTGKLCADLGKVSSRFIAEALSGICISHSVRLSEIARALQEDNPLIATIKRLSRNLNKEDFNAYLGKKILELGSSRINRDSLVVIDQNPLIKKYAEKMEYLDQAQNEDEKTVSKAYWLCDVIGWNPESKTIMPLAVTFWSQNEPGFTHEIEKIRPLVQRVRQATGDRGILVWGIDEHVLPDLLTDWTRDNGCRYLVMQPIDSRLLYNKKECACSDLYDICKTPYGDTVFNEAEDEIWSRFIEYGSLPVRLPECPDRPLWLVAVKGFMDTGESKKIVLLTTEPMRRNRTVLWWAVEAFLTSQWIRNTNRALKAHYNVEDVRVLTYDRLKNMIALVLAASYCLASFEELEVWELPTRFRRRHVAPAIPGHKPPDTDD